VPTGDYIIIHSHTNFRNSYNFKDLTEWC